MGERLPQCDADQMGVARAVSLPPQLRQTLEPLLKEVESLTEKIKNSDREIEQIARKDYPETALLQQVGGVGTLIALTFTLTIEDKNRFQKSRDVGCYVGLRPRRSDSGQSPAHRRAGDGPVPADDAGARSTIHHQPPGTGYRSKAMGPAPG
jgi:transposase